MARGAGVAPTQGSHINQNADVPPSTLAAKIVEHRSKPLDEQQPEGKELFSKLLQEYLTDPAVEESNRETNAKLIQIVAEAGLDTILRDDPFAHDRRIQQARDSIAVISLTIERVHDVLFCTEEAVPNSLPLPLFLVLLPKILSLFGRDHLDAIQEDLSRLLETCLSATGRSASLWQLTAGLDSTVRLCIEDALIALEARANADFSTAFNLSLPTAQAMAILAPGSERIIVLPRGAQAHIANVDHAAIVVLKLAQAVQRQSLSGSEIAKDVSAWTFDVSYRLCLCLSKIGHQAPNKAPAKAMQLLCKTSIATVLSKRWSLLIANNAVLICSQLAVMLRCLHVFENTSFQASVAEFILAMLSSDNQPQELRMAFEEVVRPLLMKLCHDGDLFDQLGKQFKVKLCLAYQRSTVLSGVGPMPPAMEVFLKGLNSLEQTAPESELEEVTELLKGGAHLRDANDEGPPLKRQRTDDKSFLDKPSRLEFLNALLMNKLSWPGQDPPKVHEKAIELFGHLTTQDQEVVIAALGELACAYSPVSEETGGDFSSCCHLCSNPSVTTTVAPDSDRSQDAADLLGSLIRWPGFQRSKRLRVLSMLSLRHIINHCGNTALVDLKADGSLGQWCLRSLQSSSRELRIAAARALTAFVRPSVAPSYRKANRLYALEFFKVLSDRQVLHEQESLVFAWAQVAKVSGVEELNIALLQLVEYLGHSHLLISSIAFDEILRLAEDKGCTTEELFRPYWRTIAVRVVKDLHSRPQKAQQLCELLGITVTRLLLQTQAETIPYLISTGNKNILQRIATARGIAIRDVCLAPSKHLAMTLAHLLLQNFTEPSQEILQLLCAAAPEFSETDVPELIRLEPILIACEMFKVAGEQPPSKKSSVHRAISTFVAYMARKQNQVKQSTKGSRVLLGQFLESHVLGIMTSFSGIIDAQAEVQPVAEKIRCIRAIAEMIALAGSQFNFGVAVPQIRACLQCALDNRDLCDEAFSAWATLLETVEEEDVENLIEHTFAIIVRTWNSFSEETRNKAYSLIANLIRKFNTLLRDKILSLPSLSSIPLLSKFDSEIEKHKKGMQAPRYFEAFSMRCSDENKVVVEQTLLELLPFLESEQTFIHESFLAVQPISAVSSLVRSLLDASIRFAEDSPHISSLCAQCLGIIGCVDPNRIEATRDKHEVVVLSNFERLDETVDFVAYFLEHILVKAFHSAANGRVQNYLAYAMQELLKHCEFKSAIQRPRSSQSGPQHQRWQSMSESARNTLTPYLNTRYLIARSADPAGHKQFPIFQPSMTHASWLRDIVSDLLQRGKGDNAKIFFPVLSRIIRGHELSIPAFLLPFTMLNVILGGTEQEIANLENEMLSILQYDLKQLHLEEAENVKQCSENVFQVLDYLSGWLQKKRKFVTDSRIAGARGTVNSIDFDEMKEISQISSVERIFSAIPSSVIAQRATDCHSYPRALFHWEAYLREERTRGHDDCDDLDYVYLRMQRIYAEIDEPDGIEGISSHLHILDPEQQVLELKKNGKWEAAQSWYELEMLENEDQAGSQLGLLTCLRESGQQDAILRFVENRNLSGKWLVPEAHAYAAEACWLTGHWDALQDIVRCAPEGVQGDFNVGLASCLLSLKCNDRKAFQAHAASLRENITRSLTTSNTASLRSCHGQLLKLHALHEVEKLCPFLGEDASPTSEVEKAVEHLETRLDIIGAFVPAKQYLLGIRRAAMLLSDLLFQNSQFANSWLTSARLARKSDLINVAYDALNRASKFDEDGALVEQARLLWKDGNQKKAIQNLESAISRRVFDSYTAAATNASMLTGDQSKANVLQAKAELLLAKWKDHAGQAGSDMLVQYYHKAVHSFQHWEKGHYYLGRHYNKILESERTLPISKQNNVYLTGEIKKLVIENYLRSLCFGAKYYYQTIPKILTLWLDFGQDVFQDLTKGCPLGREFGEKRKLHLDGINRQIRKYLIDRIPPWALYTAFPQIMSRIGHSHAKVWDVLSLIVVRVASAFPQQALWSVLAVSKSTARDKSSRSQDVLSRLRQDSGKKSSLPTGQLKTLISQGHKLTEALLNACEVNVGPRAGHVSLTKDLMFNPKLAPCGLVVPIEKTMTAVLPTISGSNAMRSHKPFPYGNVTIERFEDDVLVLNSLQCPRKINVRGSDGQLYGLLCKPKDDLRKDQRLMEFNAMIERSLKRDVEASKRRLYIKTYAVTPLNEECGTIEWVEGLKTIRDIILSNYKQKGIRIDFGEIRRLLEEACSDLPRSARVFTEKILPQYPAVLFEWFIEMYPEPETWYAARLRFTRSCAVMSIVGHMLGLGDRHGENILLEAESGGVFHVDFNCLFDKGRTFEKPEKVPFRLTHNIIDAFGTCGVEGPFRKAAEITLKILRQNQDTLMTILETFLYDPTADFLGSSKKKRSVPGVPETPQEVLDSVRSKLRGLMHGEKVAMGIEGYVDSLINKATSQSNLAEMYIGWCAFW